MKYIIIHHSGFESGNQLQKINMSHFNRGFPISSLGYYVGYHAVIEGKHVVQTRQYNEKGAHTYVKGQDWNNTSIGICVTGDMTKRNPTTDELRTLLIVVKSLMNRFNIPKENIINHNTVDNTLCPGYNFKSYVLSNVNPFRRVFRTFIPPPEKIKILTRAIRRKSGAVKRLLQRTLKRLKSRL